MPKWATTAASILLVVLGGILLTLSIAALLAGCASVPQSEQDEPPQSKPAEKPAVSEIEEPKTEKSPALTEAQIKKIKDEMSAKYQSLEKASTERVRLAKIEGRLRDACEIDNGHVLQAQQLCRDSPIPFSECWHIMAKQLRSCMDLPNSGGPQ